MSVKPKKHLGQHFLKDEGIAKKIAETLTGYEGYKKVVEIGPGMGVLTKYLLEKDLEVCVIEIDTDSVDYLELNYPQLHGKIYPADFLHMPLEKYFQDSFALIGNYPYNISSQILFKALEHKEQIPEITGMFQKEVAERVCAAEGSKIYGIISVLIQTYYDAEYLFTVDKEVFNPPPKVQSGVIRLKRKAKVELPVPYSFYKKVVKLAFNQRRKTLRNALKSLFPEVNEAYSGKRAEQLSVEDFKTLSAELYQNSGMS